MISIPIINSATPKKIDTNTEPAKGDAITKKDIAIAKAPAPMLNPLAQDHDTRTLVEEFGTSGSVSGGGLGTTYAKYSYYNFLH
ncbi:MAG: hypothetical protein WAM42_24085 [Candidatus Nitrosopolaris sp.]